MTMLRKRVMVEDLHALFHQGAMGTWSDGKLVTHFVTAPSGREAAFRVLIHRHGPMVLSVCRRVLGDAHAAEDTFQATFLLLVEKAETVRNRDVLAGWLYEAALRLSKKARARAERRRVVEGRVNGRNFEPEDELDRSEVRSLIDEEIRQLPERYREPLLLCYLEGLRHHEIAERLDCPVGTVESRLSRARDRLRSRLVRRGLASSIGIGLAALASSKASAAVPPKLAESTTRAAIGLISREWAGTVAAGASTLGAASWTKAGSVLFGLLTCGGLLLAGLGFRTLGTPQPEPKRPEAAASDRTEPDSVASSEGGGLQARAFPPEPRLKPTPSPSRPDSVVAVPLRGITVDGKLDDWPSGLSRHPISRRLAGHAAYDPMDDGDVDDPRAEFQVGYDRERDWVYLAVVVHDEDHAPKAGDPFHTDAVEVYVDGLLSQDVSIDGKLKASEMPVVQYVGVPDSVPAYNDPLGANPALIYGDIARSSTKMAYRAEGDVTTYEWAIQVFDRYPDRPTRLTPGKRIGFDVVVVDKDRQRKKPAWLYWGPYPSRFKGLDAGLLGELVLAEEP